MNYNTTLKSMTFDKISRPDIALYAKDIPRKDKDRYSKKVQVRQREKERERESDTYAPDFWRCVDFPTLR